MSTIRTGSRLQIARFGQFVQQSGRTESQRNARLGEDVGQFPGAQHRHGGNDDAAGLENGQIDRRQQGRVGRAQQNPVSRLQTKAACQHIGDPVHGLCRLRIAPDLSIMADQAGCMSMTARQMPVQQLRHGIDRARDTAAPEA
jgi:hypothetical protein